MVHGRKTSSYILDLLYGAKKYPCGWLKPKVIIGQFNKDENGKNQKIFFNSLLKLGFKRTSWQLVFPDQIAGLIKKIPKTNTGVDEYHIRFYRDGVIDCELEVNRFNGWHWVGPRNYSIEVLGDILDEMKDLTCLEKERIKKQFGEKEYSMNCIRGLTKNSTNITFYLFARRALILKIPKLLKIDYYLQ